MSSKALSAPEKRPSVINPTLSGTYGTVVGHVAPEAFVGGTITLVKEGDPVTLDADRRLLQLNVPEDEIARRRAQ